MVISVGYAPVINRACTPLLVWHVHWLSVLYAYRLMVEHVHHYWFSMYSGYQGGMHAVLGEPVSHHWCDVYSSYQCGIKLVSSMVCAPILALLCHWLQTCYARCISRACYIHLLVRHVHRLLVRHVHRLLV